MSWFRLYTDIINDPKVQRLPAETFRHWVNVLCVAKEYDGILPDVQTLAFRLRLTEDEAAQVIETLHENNLLDKTKRGYSPHNWNGRQYVSDVSTERVKRFRKRQCNVSETPPEQNRAEQKDNSSSKKVSRGFEDFWEAYPRKVAKGAARKAYRNALNRASPEEILAGVKRYVASKPDPKFTAHPASWLNADRWLDEDAKPQTTAVVSGPWKPFSPENEPEKPPAEERQRQVERLLRRTASGMTA